MLGDLFWLVGLTVNVSSFNCIMFRDFCKCDCTLKRGNYSLSLNALYIYFDKFIMFFLFLSFIRCMNLFILGHLQ